MDPPTCGCIPPWTGSSRYPNTERLVPTEGLTRHVLGRRHVSDLIFKAHFGHGHSRYSTASSMKPWLTAASQSLLCLLNMIRWSPFNLHAGTLQGHLLHHRTCVFAAQRSYRCHNPTTYRSLSDQVAYNHAPNVFTRILRNGFPRVIPTVSRENSALPRISTSRAIPARKPPDLEELGSTEQCMGQENPLRNSGVSTNPHDNSGCSNKPTTCAQHRT
jgi:hypothetical protein